MAGVETTGLDALRVAAERLPRIVLIDGALAPSALDHLLRSLPTVAPESRVILLSRRLDSTEAMRAVQLGVRGLVNTASSSALVFKSIRAVVAGE